MSNDFRGAKTPDRHKDLGDICHMTVIANFLKFRCHGNKGRSEVNLNDPIELAVPENYTLEPKITNLSCIQPKL